MANIEFISDIQRQIVLDHHRVKLVNGCAGSRKTDTIVKLGVYHMERYGHSLMFLTLVSSITHEIRVRLEELLGIDITRVGASNHFVGEYRGKQLTIANFDAFVHKQLEHSGDLGDQLKENGDCHDWKTSVLLELTKSGRHQELVMKTGQTADFVLVDEFQDMDPSKARILTNILRHNTALYGIAVGDMVQTIFPRAVDSDLALGHPMNIWKSQLAPACYFIDTCYRCPSPQVEFVRMLLGDQYQRYDVPLMKPFQRLGPVSPHRPVLFCHDKISKNQAAYSIAQQVCSALRVLFKHDKSLKPADVAVIMKKSNNNHVFEQLKVAMQELFEDQGIVADDSSAGEDRTVDSVDSAGSASRGMGTGTGSPFRVIHFETRGDGYHNSIDWSKADGKAVLLSIHGDKGKGHQVVFFLGLSHKCIPSENNLFKTAELVDISLVNVALTRSTKYLFVGFTLDAPSRYLVAHEDELGEYAYTSWSAREWSVPLPDLGTSAEYVTPGNAVYLPNAPDSPYRECITAMNAVLLEHRPDAYAPNFDRELRVAPLACPSKDIVRIKDDVAKDMSSVFEGILSSPAFQPEVATFGTKVRLPSLRGTVAGGAQRCTQPAQAAGLAGDNNGKESMSDATAALLGVMGELLVYRYIHQLAPAGTQTFLRKTFSPILADTRVVYTEDDRILNIVCDHGLNQYVRDEEMWSQTLKTIMATYARFMERNADVRHFFVRLAARLKGTVAGDDGRPLEGAAAPPAPPPGPVYVLSHVFSSHTFRRQLRMFMGKEKSSDIRTRVFWNVALCFNELYETIRRPSVLVHFNGFNDNIKDLQKNVDAFCDAHVRDFIAGGERANMSSVTLQAYHKLLVSERDPEVLTTQLGFVNHEDIDADRFTRGYTYGIVGRSDMLVDTWVSNDGDTRDAVAATKWERQATIYEFKTSARVDISREWVAQALMYCCIPPAAGGAATLVNVVVSGAGSGTTSGDMSAQTLSSVVPPRVFVIVNLLLGKKYTYTIPSTAAATFDRQELLVRVLKEYGFQEWMVGNLTELARLQSGGDT